MVIIFQISDLQVCDGRTISDSDVNYDELSDLQCVTHGHNISVIYRCVTDGRTISDQ